MEESLTLSLRWTAVASPQGGALSLSSSCVMFPEESNLRESAGGSFFTMIKIKRWLTRTEKEGDWPSSRSDQSVQLWSNAEDIHSGPWQVNPLYMSLFALYFSLSSFIYILNSRFVHTVHFEGLKASMMSVNFESRSRHRCSIAVDYCVVPDSL